MALSAATVLEVRNVADFAGASDTNGGGFVTGAIGTDYSQQGSPAISVTDGVTAGSTTITSATAAFVTGAGGHTGNLVSVSGGTGSVVQNWYQITSVTNTTTIVVDRSTGLTSGTGVTLKIGGALATPGGLGAVLALVAVSGMKAWWRYSTSIFKMTVATNNVSGGILGLPNVSVSLEGYDQSRGDRTGNRPQMSWDVVAAPGSITYMITAVAGSYHRRIANVNINGNSVNNVGGISVASTAGAIQCIIQNCNGTAGVGILGISGGLLTISCEATACLTGFSSGDFSSCYATGCTTGFLNAAAATKCIATLNANGFSVTVASGPSCYRCTADSNTTAGFVTTSSTKYTNCLSTNQSGGGGIGFSVGTNVATLENCASYNNTSEVTGTALSNEGMILNASFTGGQPYMVAGSDFRPNATAGAGALLRGAGIGVFGQTDNCDIGAVQHSDPSSSGGGPTGLIMMVRGTTAWVD